MSIFSSSKSVSGKASKELQDATGKAKHQKAQLKKLIDQVQGKVDGLSGVSSSVDSIAERITRAEENLDTVDTRLEASSKLSAWLERAEETLTSFQTRVEETRKEIGEAGNLATEAKESSKSLQKILDLSLEADARLKSFEKSAGELTSSEKQIAGVTAQLDEFQDRLGTMQKDYEKLHAAADSLEKCSSTLRKGGGELKKELDQAMEKAGKVEGTLSELASGEELSKSLEKQVHALNGMCEHVSQKASALDAFQGTVERANAESARVNELLWSTDRQIKKLSDNKRLMDKSTDRLAKLSTLYDGLDARIDAAKHEEKKFGSESFELTKGIESALGGLREELARTDSMRQQVELSGQRVQELNTTVSGFERQVKDLAAKDKELDNTIRKADRLEASLQTMQSGLAGVHEKAAGLAALEERLDSMTKISTEVSHNMEMLQARGSAVEQIDGKVSELMKRHDALVGKLSTLSEQGAEIDRANFVLATFRRESVDAEARAKQLTEQFQSLDGLSDRLDAALKLSDALAAKSEDLEHRLEMVETVESRVNALNELSQNVETRLGEQAARQASLESMHSTQESLGVQLKDLHQQMSSVHRSRKFTDLDKKADGLSVGLESAERRLEEIESEKRGLVDAQKTTADVMEQVEGVLSRAAVRVEELAALDEHFKEAGELRKRWEKELLELESRQKQTAVQAESGAAQLEKIGDLTKALDQKERELAAQGSKMAELEAKFLSHREMVAVLDRSIGQLDLRQSTVERVARDVNGVFDVSERVNKEATAIAASRKDILDTKELVAKLLGQTGQIEKKVSAVEQKYGAIQEAESKLAGLSHLFQDIDVNIENFQKQKAFIDHIAEKLSQMEYTIKEAEVATKVLQEERGLAERIHKTSRPKASGEGKPKLGKGVPVSPPRGVPTV